MLDILVRANTAPAEAGLARLEGRLKATHGVAGQAAGAMAGIAKVGVALGVGIGVAAVKAATDFNQQMTLVHTQAGATAKEVEHLRGSVLRMAKATEFTPTELAKGLFRVESAGFRGAKALDVLRQSANLAAVGQSDLESTTFAVTAAMRSGIPGAETAAKTVAALNVAVGQGSLRMNDLNAALSTGLLPNAKAFGLGLGDVTGALDLLTRTGVPAEAAATRLRMSISLMGAPTGRAEKALASIGLKSLDLAHAMRKPEGLVSAIGLLLDHMKNLSKSEQIQVITRAFGGARSSSAIIAMVQNLAQLRDITGTSTSRLKDFAKAVEEQAKTPAARFKHAWAEINTTLVELGSKIAPGAAKALEHLATIVSDPKLTTQEKLSKIGQAIGDALGKAAPVVAAVAAKVGAAAALAFVHAFMQAPIWAKLALEALLFAKLGGFAALRKQGAKAGLAVAEGTSAGMLAGSAEGVAGRGMVGGLLGRIGPYAKFLGKTVLGFALINGLSEAFSDKSKTLDLSGRILSGLHGVAATIGLGRVIPAPPNDFKKALDVIGSGRQPTARVPGPRLSPAVPTGPGITSVPELLRPATEKFLQLPLVKALGLGPQKQPPKIIVGHAAIDESGMSASAKRIANRLLSLQEQARKVFAAPVTLKVLLDEGNLRKTMADVNHRFIQLRDNTLVTFRGITKVVDDNAQQIRRSLGANSEAGASALEKNMSLAAHALRDSLRGGWVSSKQFLTGIRQAFEVNSKGSAVAAEVNFDRARQAIDSAVHSSQVTASAGLAAIRALFLQYLGDFGIKGGAAKLYMQGAPGSVRGAGAIGYVPGSAGQAHGGRRQRGGHIDVGEPVGDSVPAVLEKGEYVLNRKAVEKIGKHNLDDLNFKKAARFQQGGLAGLHPGIANLTQTVLHQFPGLGVSSTTGGQHAKGSYHYLGEAADLSGSSSLMNTAAAWIRSHFGGSLTEGIHNPNLSIKFGKPVSPSFWGAGTWAGHVNHIHLAVAGALQALGLAGVGGGAGAVVAKKIARMMVGGPDSPMKAGLQKGLDRVRATAQDRLNAAAAAVGAPGIGTGPGAETGAGAILHGGGNVESVFAQVARKLSTSPTATLALGEAGFDESGMRDLSYGTGSSQGPLQLLASTAKGLGISPHDIAGVASLFFTRGFSGKGGANALAAKGWPAYQVAQGVQGSATKSGSNYARFENSARAWMRRFGLDSSPVKRGRHARGGLVGMAKGGLVGMAKGGAVKAPVVAKAARSVQSAFAGVAKRLSTSNTATLALGEAGFAESGMVDLPGGDRSSQGALQLLASTARNLGVSPHDESGIARLFLTRGFTGRGGANALAKEGLPAHRVAQGVQGSAIASGSNYRAQERPARTWMRSFGLDAGYGSVARKVVEEKGRDLIQPAKMASGGLVGLAKGGAAVVAKAASSVTPEQLRRRIRQLERRAAHLRYGAIHGHPQPALLRLVQQSIAYERADLKALLRARYQQRYGLRDRPSDQTRVRVATGGIVGAKALPTLKNTGKAVKKAAGGMIGYAGDSLGVGTVPKLRSLIRNKITANTVGGRNSASGVAALKGMLSKAHSQFVFDLGTNDANAGQTAASLRAADKMTSGRPLHALTLLGPYDTKRKNATLRSMAHGDVHLVDWAKVAGQYVGGDRQHIHPNSAGYARRAGMLAASIRRYAKDKPQTATQRRAEARAVGKPSESLDRTFGRTLHALRGRSSQKVRSVLMDRLTKKLKGLDVLPGHLTDKIGLLSIGADQSKQYADWASSLTTDNPDGSKTLGVFQGHDERYWATQQLDQLWQLRNYLADAYPILTKRRTQVRNMIKKVRDQLAKLKKQIDAELEQRRKLSERLASARKAQATQRQVRGLTGAIGSRQLEAQYHQQVDRLHVERKVRVKAKDHRGVARIDHELKFLREAHDQRKTTQLKEKLRALTGGGTGNVGRLEGGLKRLNDHIASDRSATKNLRTVLGASSGGVDAGSGLLDAYAKVNEAISGGTSGNAGTKDQLAKVQGEGPGIPMTRMKTMPPIGFFGGDLFDAQLRLQGLNAPTQSTAQDSAAAADKAGILTELLRQANLRTAVSEKQFEVFKNFPQFGGTFHTGGVVAGPAGQERMAVVKSGEGVFTPDQMAAMGPQGPAEVHLHFAPGTEWLKDYVKVTIGQETRRMTRGGRAPLPGRGGGL